jgi:hypothetical protein
MMVNFSESAFVWQFGCCRPVLFGSLLRIQGASLLHFGNRSYININLSFNCSSPLFKTPIFAASSSSYK